MTKKKEIDGRCAPRPQYVREKIKITMLINRLQDNALGLLDPAMTAGEIKTAQHLVDKYLPSLSAVESQVKQETSFLVEAPMQIDDPKEWEDTAGIVKAQLEKAKSNAE